MIEDVQIGKQEVLDAIMIRGVDWVMRSKPYGLGLQKLLDGDISNQFEVDGAELQYRDMVSKNALGSVKALGKDWVNGDTSQNRNLEHGLNRGFYTQSEIDVAQSEYLGRRSRESLALIRIRGIGFVSASAAFGPHLQYGLDHELYTQEAVDEAQRVYEENNK